jgi:hypothetical protein
VTAPLAARAFGELNALAFMQRRLAAHLFNVHENITLAVIAPDEPETSIRVELCHRS